MENFSKFNLSESPNNDKQESPLGRIGRNPDAKAQSDSSSPALFGSNRAPIKKQETEEKIDPLFTQSRKLASRRAMAEHILKDKSMVGALGLKNATHGTKLKVTKGITGGFTGIGRSDNMEKIGDAILRRNAKTLKEFFPDNTVKRLLNNPVARRDALHNLGSMTSSAKGKRYSKFGK